MLHSEPRTVPGRGLTVALACGLGSLAIACSGGANTIPVATAESAVYQDKFDPLFMAVVDEVKRAYPNVGVNAPERTVKTAWHPLPLSEQVQTRENTARTPSGVAAEEAGRSGNENFDLQRQHRRENTRVEKRYFVRFDVSLIEVPGSGGQRWQVKIVGQASAWDGTAAPELLKGGERPYWLDTRLRKLHAALYQRLAARRVSAPQAPGAQPAP